MLSLEIFLFGIALSFRPRCLNDDLVSRRMNRRSAHPADRYHRAASNYGNPDPLLVVGADTQQRDVEVEQHIYYQILHLSKVYKGPWYMLFE